MPLRPAQLGKFWHECLTSSQDLQGQVHGRERQSLRSFPRSHCEQRQEVDWRKEAAQQVTHPRSLPAKKVHGRCIEGLSPIDRFTSIHFFPRALSLSLSDPLSVNVEPPPFFFLCCFPHRDAISISAEHQPQGKVYNLTSSTAAFWCSAVQPSVGLLSRRFSDILDLFPFGPWCELGFS